MGWKYEGLKKAGPSDPASKFLPAATCAATAAASSAEASEAAATAGPAASSAAA